MRNTYTYTNPDTGEVVEEQLEMWQWHAHYDNGVVLHQFDEETGAYHKVSEIDQDHLELFEMTSHKFFHKYTLLFDPRVMRLIHRYRTGLLNTGEIMVKLYLFGYAMRYNGQALKLAGKPIEVVNTITPEGDLVISHDFNAVNTG